MAPASNEDQFKFLISCIRYSNNGKVGYQLIPLDETVSDQSQVDFDLVKDECGIISKGAAYVLLYLSA